MTSAARNPMPTHLVAIGRTSKVYRWTDGVAAKVLERDVPAEWAELEASFTESVRRVGVPAPEVFDVITLDGRPAILFRLVDGPSMWQQMCDRPSDASRLVDLLVEVQRAVHGAGVPDRLPSLASRMRLKLDASSELTGAERRAARNLLQTMSSGCALLHGDLHPGNILLSRDGPVVIDWFDATVGHPEADLARTALLLQANGATDLRHLPGGTPELAEMVEQMYLERVGLYEGPSDSFGRWKRLMAASRLAERTDVDSRGLLEMWRSDQVATTNDRRASKAV